MKHSIIQTEKPRKYLHCLLISALTWNETFDLPDGFYSVDDIQDYFEFIIKKHETLAANLPVEIYPNKIKNRIIFKIQTGHKLDLLTPETMRLLKAQRKMLMQIKMEKLYQNQNFLKFFSAL